MLYKVKCTIQHLFDWLLTVTTAVLPSRKRWPSPRSTAKYSITLRGRESLDPIFSLLSIWIVIIVIRLTHFEKTRKRKGQQARRNYVEGATASGRPASQPKQGEKSKCVAALRRLRTERTQEGPAVTNNHPSLLLLAVSERKWRLYWICWPPSVKGAIE